MNQAHTTDIFVETADYFVAHLNNGGVRVGQFGLCAVDFPSTHARYAEACALTTETVEAFFDSLVESGHVVIA